MDQDGKKQYAGSEDTGSVIERISPEDDLRIRRTLERWLLPVMALSYAFQYLDKSALASTAILGLRTDLKLTGNKYSWASSICYFGYLIASYPAGLMMVKWKVGKSITLSILIWGAVLMVTAACHNAAGLLATRFFLGVAESAIAPGLTIMISMFYKRKEQPLCHAAWFLGNTTAGALGGLLNFGIGHIRIIAPWKLLSKEDREKAVIRVKDNLTGIKSNELKWDQFKEDLTDPKTWFLFFLQIGLNIPNGGITSFRSIILQGIGFSTFQTLLLQMAPYGLQLILVIVCTVGSRIWEGTRTYWMMMCFALALVGAALVRELPEHDRWGRYAGTCLMGGYSGCFPLVMSLMSGNVGGFTKKTTVNALVFIAYCAGNIIGPQLFFAREAPRYDSGFAAMMVSLSACFVLSYTFRRYFIWVNKNRDLEEATMDMADADPVSREALSEAMAMDDKTDTQIRNFRYVY
ncbi:major facilitator superfamily transporter [Fusarium subglutinans]|uniref:Major facilitator superfamily transporter n=1 Tax=Gibberella subglutinans TaxID=42677 RepID=A0A8H5UPC7_GIBSU|nr:major facilitator superfamily transporter [Fusarium subglutinans]KAF5593553.1 major facilitator superfamily transporter [Fusarium subglutinans]